MSPPTPLQPRGPPVEPPPATPPAASRSGQGLLSPPPILPLLLFLPMLSHPLTSSFLYLQEPAAMGAAHPKSSRRAREPRRRRPLAGVRPPSDLPLHRASSRPSSVAPPCRSAADHASR